MKRQSFDIVRLSAAYQSGAVTAEAVALEALERIGRDPKRAWIHVLDAAALRPYTDALAKRSPAELPLYGIPFAIKDNIDLAGVPTTAACPAFAYTPQVSSPVVARLIAAGAIPIGKTNLDQFATGLNGTRSPYGACQNAFDSRYVSGGSSAGSAVSVALGQVSFALGTDTAGSGRVPAAFNHLVGLKPTRGLLSARGVVPACRSLDAVSILALSADDAHRVFAAGVGFDVDDPYSRRVQPHGFDFGVAPTARVGVPRRSQWEFLGNDAYARAYASAIEHARHLGAHVVEIDFEPFFETAQLLYGGPWVAERYQAIRDFAEAHPEALFPVTREITLGGAKPLAADAFAAQYRLRELERVTEAVWREIDTLLLPTTPIHPLIEDMQAAPIERNSALGVYTNFVNLLDYAAVAVPFCLLESGLPFGVTLVARAHQDVPLLHYARRWQESLAAPALVLGATGQDLPGPAPLVPAIPSGQVRMAFCASGSDQAALWAELAARGARRVGAVRTAPAYRVSEAIVRGLPRCAGLVCVAERGNALALDLWEFGMAEFGALAAQLDPPWAIGSIHLANGDSVRAVIHASAHSHDQNPGSGRGGRRPVQEQFR